MTATLDQLGIDPEVAGMFTRPDYLHVLARLRAEAPVFGYRPNRWAITRYDDVRTISRDPERFCSNQGVLIHDPRRDGMELPGSILHMDPPEHTEWRKLASRWFTPRQVAALTDRVRTIVDEVLVAAADAAAPGEAIDLVDTVAAPIPVLVIAELLGLGHADRHDIRRWSDACIDRPDQTPDEAMSTMGTVAELLEFLTSNAAERRAQPRADLLSELVGAQVDGRDVTDDEVVLYCMSVLVAGNETTRHLLSGAVEVLANHPDQRDRLAADPGGLGDAIEECLRWVTPIQAFCRTATADTELAGQGIAAGDWLVLLYASANRDESVFGTDADRFRADRPANPAHLAFGFGEHLCLGAALARLEGRVFLERLLARFPRFDLAGPGELGRSTLVRGHSSLPVVLR